eukprot:TRINITY_DN14114_c0_g1_i1.p1 TRINITY_DN14114_c0_g1~~TRINITY_DN14114_c0_g1_i1.p1  ORF type:complete len:643 (+),score=151.82 TRINITY_DN14114_c0_g1_i1:132-2060(+)
MQATAQMAYPGSRQSQRPTTIQERFPPGHPFRKWLPQDGLFEINKAQLDCKEIVEHIPIFLNCLFFNVKSIRNRAEIREKGKTMREEYYKHIGEIPPRQRTLSVIPAKPERIIDTEIMEPSIASPRRSYGDRDKPVPPPENRNVARDSEPERKEHKPQEVKKEVKEVKKEEEVVPAITVNTCAKEAAEAKEKPKMPSDLHVVRVSTMQPLVMGKSVSTGDVGGPASQNQGLGSSLKNAPGAPSTIPEEKGMKRAISEGVLPNKEKEKKRKEEELTPLELNGLFERLAPCDETVTEDGEALRHLVANASSDKIKQLLPSSLRKAMEQKAREYQARPNIRSYSRTIYNMAEIEKWIKPQNPKTVYSIAHLLGQGAYGEVYAGQALDTSDTRKYAIKITPNLFDRPTKIHDLTNEIRFLEECKNPNIVEHVQSYIWNKEIWTVMEYCDGGNLADVVQDGALQEELAAYITKEILKGVAYLHQCNKIHRDLKGDNILISSTEAGGVSIKIADFGLMTQGQGDSGRTSICGSRYWMSPEMLKAEGYGTKSDIWSVGCIIYEMLTEGPPYIQFRSLKAIFYTATRGVEPLEGAEYYSRGLQDILQCIFKRDPRRRWSAEQLLMHPWVKDVKVTESEVVYALRHLWYAI